MVLYVMFDIGMWVCGWCDVVCVFFECCSCLVCDCYEGL